MLLFEVEILVAISDVAAHNPRQTADEILKEVTSTIGDSGFSQTDLIYIYNLSLRLGPKLVKCFSEFHFASINPAAIRMSCTHMASIATIDETNAFIKVAILIAVYLGLNNGNPAGQSCAQMVHGPKKDALTFLAENTEFTAYVEKFLKVVGRSRRYSILSNCIGPEGVSFPPASSIW